MPRYEYKVVPAPTKGLKTKGVRTAEARFAHAVQELMNGLSGYGWEYLRAETLPSLERSGLTGSTTEWRNVLVFRRPREGEADDFAPELLAAPADVAPPVPEEKPIGDTAKNDAAPTTEKPKANDTGNAIKKPETEEPWDNGVEDTDDMVGVSSSLEELAKARKADKSDA